MTTLPGFPPFAGRRAVRFQPALVDAARLPADVGHPDDQYADRPGARLWLAAYLRTIWPRSMVLLLVSLLFVANTINIGANLSAMGASAELATGLPSMPATIAFADVSLVLQMFVPYHRYAAYLKWLTMVLLSYVAVLFVVKIDWLEAGKGLVMPSLELDGETFTVIVAILGTMISPLPVFLADQPGGGGDRGKG